MKKILLSSLAVTLLAAIIIIPFLIIQKGGYSHPESNAFLQIYTDDTRPLINILFDPQLTDWNHYQARELSYFFDWIDANIILLSCRMGAVHFYSFVTIILLLGTVFLQQIGIRKLMPQIPETATVLISLFYVLAPSNAGLLFFRSAKPLCAFFLTMLCFSVLAVFRRRDDLTARCPWAWAGFTIPVILLPYCDRQGAFSAAVCAMAGAGTVLLSAIAPLQKFFAITPQAANRAVKATLIAMAGVLLSAVYNMWAAPALIRHLNGYSPSFEYQNIGGGGVFNFAGGCWFYLANIGHSILGIYSWPALITGAAALAAWAFFCWRITSGDRRRCALLLTLAGAAGAMLVSANLMTFRHPLMLRDDVIYGGYFMPMLAVLVILLLLTFEVAADAGYGNAGKWLSRLTLLMTAAAVLRTVLPAPEVHDHLAFYKRTAPYTREALRDPAFNHNRVTIPYSSAKLIEHFRRRNGQTPDPNTPTGR